MRRDSRLVHRSLAALGALSVVALMGALSANPAAAAVTGMLEPSKFTDGSDVTVTHNGKTDKIDTTLFRLKLSDDAAVPAYCIDFTTRINSSVPYIEDDWGTYPNPDTDFAANPEKVNWVLHNSFPDLELSEVKLKTGIVGLDESEAIAGTQVAIWHFSNGTKPTKANNNSDVLKLYEYLVGPLNTGLADEPSVTLSITPESVSGVAGNNVGSFTVKTNAESAKVSIAGPDGVRVVNGNGDLVNSAKNGDVLSVQVPSTAAAGDAVVNVEVATKVLTGRLFRGDTDKSKTKTQTLITAKTTEVTAGDKARANWTAKPVASESPSPSASPSASVSPVPVPSQTTGTGGSLPVTGVQAGLLATIGVALVGGGAAMFLIARRRKIA